MDLLVACGLAASKGEARRLVQQGGVSVNDEKVPDISASSFPWTMFVSSQARISLAWLS